MQRERDVAILDAAKVAFSAMQNRLGDYPHPTFRVVQSAGGYGMESPGLIWIPYGTGSANLRYLVAHETAHQWFYGIVGNDQARQPFADEALADFMARNTLGLRSLVALLDRSTRPDRSTSTRAPATTRSSTSRAATSSMTPGSGWARRCSGGRCASTSPTNATG